MADADADAEKRREEQRQEDGGVEGGKHVLEQHVKQKWLACA